MSDKDVYRNDLDAIKRSEPDWVRQYRNESTQRFSEISFPSSQEEEWRFSNIASLLKIPFHTNVDSNGKVVAVEDFKKFTPDSSWPRLAFVNGRFSLDDSSLPEIEGIQYGNLQAGITKSDFWKQYLGATLPGDASAFTALNSAFLQGGALLHVSPGAVLRNPIHLIFVTTKLEDEAVHPRNVIVAGKGSQFSLLESYVGSENGRYFSNAVTEVLLEDGAVVEHCKIQEESGSGFHVSSWNVVQGRDSSYTSFLFTLGGTLSRNDLSVRIHGPGASCVLNGVYLLSGNQVGDHHTVIDHATAHTSSQELYKGILSGHSRGVFNGRIVVRKDAQKTDARQVNRNLLISDHARINTKPQLEILADDVKCTHGATIGHLEDAELFYLQSRGIDETEARRMLMNGFVGEVSDRLRNGSLQKFVHEMLHRRLTGFTVGVHGARPGSIA